MVTEQFQIYELLIHVIIMQIVQRQLLTTITTVILYLLQNNADLKYEHEAIHDNVSRPIETAATDSKSQTNITQSVTMKRIGKSLNRRKQKNLNIRKINKRTNRLKKSAKSLVKHDNECIHEKVEDENMEVRPAVIEKHYSQDVTTMVSPDKSSKKSKLSSLRKPVNELILLQK